MLMIFAREQYLDRAEAEALIPLLAEQSRMLHAFRQTLKRS
jgi:hypothetical protein